MNYADHKAHLAAIAALLHNIRSACEDSERRANAAEPRVTVTCGELRMACDEIDRLNAALVRAYKDI